MSLQDAEIRMRSKGATSGRPENPDLFRIVIFSFSERSFLDLTARVWFISKPWIFEVGEILFIRART